jgi:DNA-binding CsgD family transcriptional regulator
VKSYLQSSLRKLGARNRAEAVFMLGELRLL